MIQTASPDAIVRLKRTDLAEESDEIRQIYFEQQPHESIEDFLNYHVKDAGHDERGCLMQVFCSIIT